MTLLNTPETPPWWRNAEGCGLLSLEKRGLWGDLIANFQCIKGAYMKGRDKHLPRPLATGQRIMVLNWEGLGLGWTWRNSLLWGWWGTGRGCSGKLWMPCLWKWSIPGCMGLWATWSSARCHGRTMTGWGYTIWPLKVSSNSKHPVILMKTRQQTERNS